MEQRYPEHEAAQVAVDGTAAHDLAESVLMSALRMEDVEALEGTVHMGAAVAADMLAGIKLYVDKCVELRRSFTDEPNLREIVERSVAASQISPRCTGLMDYGLVGEKRLVLVDFKMGYLPVEAFGNWQMLCYLAGVLEEFYTPEEAETLERIELYIVEPRAPHPDGAIRKWTPSIHDIKSYLRQLKRQAEIALGPSPYLKTGDHCRDCSAIVHCEPAVKAALQLYEASGSVRPLDVTPEYLSYMYTLVDRASRALKFVQEGLRSEITERQREGVSIPGYGREPGIGRLRWNDPEAAVRLFRAMGRDDMLKAITPTQAKAKIGEDMVKALANRPDTPPKLVKVDEKRIARILGTK